MSEVQSRPAPAQRGRGSARGGRGGSFGARSGGFVARGARPTNGFQADDLEEQGEVGQLLKKYANELGPLKEMFPDWTSADIVYALEENEGDVQMTAEKISEGVCMCYVLLLFSGEVGWLGLALAVGSMRKRNS